jgi:hypothetical protein
LKNSDWTESEVVYGTQKNLELKKTKGEVQKLIPEKEFHVCSEIVNQYSSIFSSIFEHLRIQSSSSPRNENEQISEDEFSRVEFWKKMESN